MVQRLRFYLLKLLYPFMKFAAKLGKPEPKVTAEFYYELVDKLEVGDILLSKEDLKLTNVLIPGFWSHAAIYAEKNYVVEAIGSGVIKTPLVQWVLSKDHIMVLRMKNVSKELRERAGQFSLDHVGEGYDYEFSSGNQAWYCAELAYFVYDEVMGDGCPFKLQETFGVPTVTPEDFAQAKDKMDLIACFDGPHT